ncbi:MAG: hypothetical protein Q4A65_08170 [Bacillota bacterium]|nr:hypothetical protein [Bacillota bacterium]
MANIDLELSKKITNILADGIKKNYRDFYYLAYFLSEDEELAVNTVKDCIKAGIYNARKIQDVPPIKTWFYQDLIAICDRRKKSERKHTNLYRNKLMKKMLDLDIIKRATFILYFYEEFETARVAKILRLKEAEVQQNLKYIYKELGLKNGHCKQDESKIDEMLVSYRTPSVPNYLRGEIQDVIEHEQAQNVSYFTRGRRSRFIRSVFAVAILVLAAYLLIKGNLF